MKIAARAILSIKRPHFERSVIALLSLLLIGAAHIPAKAESTKNEPNCGKQKIRRDGIRKPTHGVDMYLYPDADQINARYSGCQNIWLEDGFLLVQAKYREGEIQSYKAWEPKSKEAVSCVYANKKLLKAKPDAVDCPPFDAFPLKMKGKAK